MDFILDRLAGDLQKQTPLFLSSSVKDRCPGVLIVFGSLF